tara:strand:+ start:6104 stop:6817 length:714 start_codon:yes stop_codon:yes gene_type:complete
MSKKAKDLAVIDFDADSGAGLENIGTEDIAIPYINIIQKVSPALEEIDGSKPGDIFNSVSHEVYQELRVIPCAYKRAFVEWKPRSQGGGFVGEHSSSSSFASNPRNEKGEIVLDNGNVLVETAYFYVITCDTFERAVINMSSTNLKVARRWNGQMLNIKINGKTPAMFSHSYVVSTVLQKNDKGTWYTFDIKDAMQLDNVNHYNLGKSLSTKVIEGKMQATPPSRQSLDKPNGEDHF